MTRYADLHIHTHFSDSTSSPEEVVEQAHEHGLSCIAIADHDTVDGIAPTITAAQKYNIEVIPAVELSTEADGRDIHILGYLFDFTSPELLERLKMFQDSRMLRMEKMIEKLSELGIDDIALKEVTDLAQSPAVGRPHLAQVLERKGHVKSIKQAFDKFLADGAPAYIPKLKQTPLEAIELMKQSGGISVLAHPMFTNVDELIPQFVKAGLDGIEVFYPNTVEKVRTYYEQLAEKHGLLKTGGSDAHGDAKKNTYVGKEKVPYEVVDAMKAYVQQRR